MLVQYQVFFFDNIDTFCKDSLLRDILREAIVWRSLSHRFILPFLGVYEGKPESSLVSPLMENGTLTQWRRKQERGAIEIHRMVRHTVFVRTIEQIR
jgi:serine/threonine protein kinase